MKSRSEVGFQEKGHKLVKKKVKTVFCLLKKLFFTYFQLTYFDLPAGFPENPLSTYFHQFLNFRDFGVSSRLADPQFLGIAQETQAEKGLDSSCEDVRFFKEAGITKHKFFSLKEGEAVYRWG